MTDSLNLTSVAGAVVTVYLAALGALVVMQLLNGGISTRNLLRGRLKNGQLYFSPERVQLLVTTLWVATNYLTTAIASASLPDIPPQTLALLGGSHALYLGGKALARFAPAQPN